MSPLRVNHNNMHARGLYGETRIKNKGNTHCTSLGALVEIQLLKTPAETYKFNANFAICNSVSIML